MNKGVKDKRGTGTRHASAVDVHVGGRLRTRRTALGLTQADVARLARTSSQQVQKYESGRDRIPAARLFELSGLLGVSIGWFFEDLDGTAQSKVQRRPVVEADVVKLLGAYNRISNDADKVIVRKIATSLASRKDGKE